MVADLDEREPVSIQHGASPLGADAASPAPFHPLATCLAAGLGAGLLAFGLGELTYDAYKAKLVPTNLMGSIAMLPSTATQQTAVVKNAGKTYTVVVDALDGPELSLGSDEPTRTREHPRWQVWRR